MQEDQQDQILLETIRHLALQAGDIIPVAVLFEKVHERGIERSAMEDALIHATANGWVVCSNDEFHLTLDGVTVLYPSIDKSAN